MTASANNKASNIFNPSLKSNKREQLRFERELEEQNLRSLKELFAPSLVKEYYRQKGIQFSG